MKILKLKQRMNQEILKYNQNILINKQEMFTVLQKTMNFLMKTFNIIKYLKKNLYYNVYRHNKNLDIQDNQNTIT